MPCFSWATIKCDCDLTSGQMLIHKHRILIKHFYSENIKKVQIQSVSIQSILLLTTITMIVNRILAQQPAGTLT